MHIPKEIIVFGTTMGFIGKKGLRGQKKCYIMYFVEIRA